ncbi:unnamed protein product [Symbiodinium microadriaticum]|nr:unnamed protein product [Symbiodinium microadriaticum]
MPASAGTVCASSCLAFVVCIMNYASMDADVIDQSLRPDLIRLIQCIMTMQKLTMWEEQAKFLCELRGIMSVCVASWDNARAMFSLPATYPPLADYAWPVAAARPMAKLLEDQFMCSRPEEQSKLTDIVMGNFTDPFLVILDEDEEDETSLLDKAVEANMEFLKVQHVVAKAKRTLESNNPVMYELKQLCGPKLLEKSKSNPKKPVEPEGGFIAQFSASRRLKLHTSTLHAQVRMMLHSRYVSTPRALWRWICKDCRHLLLLRNSWKLSSVISRAGLQHVSTMPSSIRNSSGSSSSRDKDRQTNTGAA